LKVANKILGILFTEAEERARCWDVNDVDDGREVL
jgi:hypothetical protein